MGSDTSRVRYKREKKEMPLPAFLPGIRGHADWHMREAKPGETPHTINNRGQNGEFVIPMSTSHNDQVIKLHELLHAAHSPVEAPRDIISANKTVKVDYILIAEEYRINMYLRYLVNLDLPKWDDGMVAYTTEMFNRFFRTESNHDLMELLKWLFVVVPLWPHNMNWPTAMMAPTYWPEVEGEYAQWSDLRGIFEGIYEGTVYSAVARMMAIGDIFDWKYVVQLALALQEFQEKLDNPGKFDGRPKEIEELTHELKEMAHQQIGFGEADEDEPAYKRALRRLHTPKDPMEQMLREGKPTWGRMLTRKLKFTKKLPENKLARKKNRASDEGSVPRYVHRLPIDGKIFARKKRSLGGSVLLDDSGSMSWGLQDIQDIVEAAPASIIAAYAGAGSRGELVIVAEKGKYADVNDAKNRPAGGGNYVDLPALEWLAKQPKPRIWVSDAQTYPVEGNFRLAVLECLSFCERHEINLVSDAKEAHAVFTGERELNR